MGLTRVCGPQNGANATATGGCELFKRSGGRHCVTNLWVLGARIFVIYIIGVDDNALSWALSWALS